MHRTLMLALPLPLFLLASPMVGGCSSSDTSTPGPDATSGGSTADGGADAAKATLDAGEAGAAGAGDMPSGDPAAVNAWLQTKSYLAWPHESAPHASTGPHGGSVQTYLDPKLDASMKAGNAEHPVGAAAVKEFLTGGKLSGWAAYVKTQAKSDNGKGWYWYEVFSVQPGASPIAGQGNTTCTGCHAGGKDFVLAPYPLK